MYYIIYNFLAVMLFIFVILPYFTWRYFREKGFPRRFRQSVGLIRDDEIAAVAHKNCIWIHGASVGEIVATSPLVKEIKKAMPDAKVLVSAVTSGGYNMAHQIIPEADAIIYFPIDLPFVSESFVKRIMPRIFMPVETELWPNFLRAMKLRKIPVMMVNGRISDRSAKTYHYLFGILADMMGSVTRFCMQSTIDAAYIEHLGAEKRRIFVTGNTKFDQTYAEVTPEDLTNYRMEMGLKDDYPVLVAGSTHPTEEEALFKAFIKIRKEFPKARLVVAPRKPGRIEEIVNLAKNYDLQVGLRSELKKLSGERPDYPVVLIDTIGELGRIYAVGDAVFVGGSLVNHGGHNALEPAAHAKPIVVGPSMSNFKDTFNLLSKVGALRQVSKGDELADVFLEIFKDDALRAKMGAASFQVIKENGGAAVRTIKYLEEVLAITATESMVNTHYKINTRNINDEISPKMRTGDAVTQYLIKLSHGDDNGPVDWLVLAILRIFSVLYEIGVRIKLSCYLRGILPQNRLKCCVISIGNITVGGTGKTPTAQKVALMIQKMGYKVVILNRGYRSHWEEEIGVVSDGNKIYMTAYEAGDEAFLLAKTLPGIPVVIGKERSITGKFAVDKLQAEVIILDDGYQHWQLYRDLDVVLVDTLNMFGNGSILPRGTLREPLPNLNRAGLFLLTKCDQSSSISRATLGDTLHKYAPNAPVIESTHKPCDYVEIADWYKSDNTHTVSLEALRGQSVMVFSAIGNPASFEQTISSEGLNIEEAIRYPDHHDYGMLEMQYIMDRAVSKGVKALITTGKDAVKIPTEFIYLKREVPLYILDMEIQITSGQDIFENTIRDAIKKEIKK